MKIKLSKSQWEKIGREAGWSREDVQGIKELRDRSVISLNDASKIMEVIKDCVTLSSGTLANLTGIKDYSELEDIQADFVLFTKNLIPKMYYKTWMEAWADFVKRNPNYLATAPIQKS